MKQLVLVCTLLLALSCTRVPEEPPKGAVERATESLKPPEETELATADKEPSHYQVLERGRAHKAMPVKSRPVTGQRSAAGDKGAVKEAFPLLNLEDASLWEVIKIVADYRQWNYVIDPTVPDKGINIRLNTPVTGMDVENVLHLLLSIYNVAMVEHDGMVYFVPAKGADYKLGAPFYRGNQPSDASQGEGWVTQVIPLHFVSPKDLSPILKEFVSTGGKIIEDPVTSTVVVIDRLPYVRKILEMVSLFDVNVFKNKRMLLIRFENADAEKVMNNIQEIIKGYGGISEDKYFLSNVKELNALLCISSIQEIIDEVKYWADKFEKESEVGEAQIFVYHVENAKAGDLAGIIKEIYADDHTSTKNAEGKVEMRPVLKGDFKIITDEANNSLIFKTTRRDYNIIQRTLQKLDKPKKQVLIEAMILDISLSDSMSYGFNYFLKHRLADTVRGASFDLTPGAQSGAFSGGYTFLSGKFQVETILNMDEVKSRAKVLSTPHIVVLDNEQASIDVGEQISIQTGTVSVPSATQNANTGFYNSTSYQYLSTGVTLQVKPSISSNGMVRLEVSQKYSVPGASSGGGNPPIKNRSAQTIINVPDGQSLIIGGMIQETHTNDDGGVPVLNRIPLVKYFFSSRSSSHSKSELIIILTPHVLYTPDDGSRITEEFRREIDKFRTEVYGTLD